VLVTQTQLNRHVVLVTLERPDARNAVNAALTAQLQQTVMAIERDDDVRAVILTGSEEKAFCAGADLKEVSAGGLDDLFTAEGGFAGFTHVARRKPWIAAVNGAALAGGCELALACDMIVAADHALFGLPEVTRGLIASAGGLYRLPRAIPACIARELIATGKPIPADRALSLGLVNRVVPAADLIAAAQELAETIAANAPLAVQASLAVARQSVDHTDRELYELGNAEQEKMQATSDFREGSLAFVEKRAPNWTGR
jgi:enoyl-CoA hydratase/carnithine racemase